MIPLHKDTLLCGKVGIDHNPLITNQEWREWKNQDKTIVEIKNLLQTILRHKHQFILRNGLLYKKIQFHSCNQPLLQFVLPQNYG